MLQESELQINFQVKMSSKIETEIGFILAVQNHFWNTSPFPFILPHHPIQ